MRKFLKYSVLTVAVLMSFGCNLDQEVYSEYVVDDYVNDADDVERLLTGAYNGLQGVLYYEWAVTELRSDNARSRAAGSTSQDTKLIEQLDQGVITTAHDWVSEYWSACYAAIDRANRTLAALGVVTDEAQRTRIEAEAKFLRAHIYFNLVRLWGPVFKVTESLTPEEARYMQRSPKEEIYDLIEGDLTYIVDQEMLPVPAEIAADQKGRVTLQAAEALLAKVYMTRYKKGTEAYTRAGELLHDALNMATGWVGSYADIFSINNEMNPEIVFAVRYMSGNVGLGSPFGTLFGPQNNGNNVIMGSPKHYNYPTDNLILAYKANEGDLRKEVTLKESYFNQTTGKEVTGASARWCDKFLSPITTEYDGENDWPVIRLGDVVLLLAEWINETDGPTEEAFELLNRIRTRAGGAEYTAAELTNRSVFRRAVREERRLELACENQRWFDLLRWGVATETVNAYFQKEITFYDSYGYAINPIEDWQLMLPIPLSVKNINPNVAQNAGY